MVPTVHLSGGTTEARFFCNALALSTDERLRYGELARTLRAAVSGTRERDRGLAFRIELERMSLPLLAEWVTLSGNVCRGQISVYDTEVCMQTKWIVAVGVSIGFVLAARADDARKGLSDPQIATVALTAHQIDIDRGKTAMRKTRNAEVKQFAEQMVHDHQEGKQEVLALANQLGVKPEESDVTKSLEADAKKVARRLAKEKGAAFDRDYIDTEVAYHQAVIEAVNKVLIPGAQNAQVKTALQNTVPTLEGHLQHARNVQAQLPAKTARR